MRTREQVNEIVRLLLEEYPLSEAHIREEDGRWIFDADIMRLEGIGRFVMGLLDQVEILEGEPLRCYVLEKCRGQEARFSKPLNP